MGRRWYRYFNTETKGVDFEGMKADISNAPDGSVIVLHACAHNPTGADLTLAQWQELSSVMMAKSHFPFFDCAYQGFASGVGERSTSVHCRHWHKCSGESWELIVLWWFGSLSSRIC